ncbi:PRC-barrel domain-containing protein [Altericista sp. CCNU0014]|uniref:PRC-barrel domain-containing protein n=1 Tax=Altericista sp. CCNU0014 TaxID=3082949 RepID=UPI00384F3F8E
MSDSSPTYRHSELLHRLVLDRTTAEEFGKVEVVWMHPEAHRVMGFISKSSFLTKKRFAFKLSQLLTIGAEGIVVNSLPVETDTEHVGVLETLIGHELWSDAGNRLGHITDCLFDLETGKITAYLFRSQGWHGFIDSIYKLPTRGIVQIGKKRVLVAERAVPSIAAYQEGIEQKVVQVAEDLQSLTETAQTTTKRLGKQVRAIAEQATQKAKAAREEFPSQEALKTGRSLLEQLQERAQSIGKELKEELTPFAQQIRSSIQPPTKPTVPKSREGGEPNPERIPQQDIDDDEPWI